MSEKKRSMAAEEDPIHPHCLNCVNVAKCSARLEKRVSCQIVHCKLECGASFHACKGDEHQLLCANVKVPCANAVNGCPAWMLRNQLGSHLQHCPASLVFCTAEWNRWGWRRSKTMRDPQYVHRQCADQSGRLQLDFALAMRDLRSLTDKDIRRPKPIPKKSKDGTAVPVAAPPVGIGSTGSHRYPYNGSCGSGSYGGVPIASLLNGYINMQEGKKSDLSSAITDAEIQRLKEAKKKHIEEEHKSMRLAGARYAWRHHLDLNTELCVEFLTRYQVKPDTVYTFSCSQVFRRDEYAWHYQNVHRDIHCGLNGWLEHRCPLAQYGCTYSRRMFHPILPGSQLVFSEVLESFGLSFTSAVDGARPSENGDAGESCSKRPSGTSTNGSEVLKAALQSSVEKAKPNGKGDAREGARPCLANGHLHTSGACNETGGATKTSGKTLSDLPFEILQFIAGFLDAFSLNNLSLVSKRLRDVSCSLLTSRGMVVLKWERLGKRCWNVRSESWYFSNGFSPITDWVLSDEEHMSNHLKQCRYFEPNIKKRPTAVCFGIGNSRPKTMIHVVL